jgi:transcriptional regulator GlxA family with amidase domain
VALVQNAPDVRGRGLAPWQVKLVLGLMARDLAIGVAAQTLASACGLSRSYFTRAFKISLGVTPHRWLVGLRVRRAKELLERTSESISGIAVSCGFCDQSHLTRTFQATTGSSPAAWRRRRRAFAPRGDRTSRRAASGIGEPTAI